MRDKIDGTQRRHKSVKYGDQSQAIVVGAGPAGSVCALLLARAGIDVLLLDRAQFPRAKPCGDCLSAQATLLLGELGLLDHVLALRPAWLHGWRILGPGTSGFEAAFHGTNALALPRLELDAALLRAAEAAGARVLTGARVGALLIESGIVCGVRCRTDTGTHDFRARIVIGADGLRSRVARELHAVRRAARLRKLSLTAHLRLPRADDGFGEMHVGDGLCLGVAPVGGGLWNVTLVAVADRFGRAAAHDTRQFFRAAIATFPRANVRPEGNAPLLASGPFDRPVRASTHEGAALLGDAAGYYDPFTGQGVYQAMAGAAALAPVVVEALRRNGPVLRSQLEPYRRAHRSLTGGARALQHVIEAVLSRPRLASPVLDMIAARPALASTLIAVTGDLAPARALLPWFHPERRQTNA